MTLAVRILTATPSCIMMQFFISCSYGILRPMKPISQNNVSMVIKY